MDGINLAIDIVSEVNNKVRRVYWTNEEIDRLFGRRSAKEIIQNGTTCFMNPCFDLNSVSSYFMNVRGIPHEYIIEELSPTKDFNFNKSYLELKNFDYRLHFALGFQHGGEEYAIDYKRENEVHIFKGKYNGRGDIPRAGIIRIPGKNINPYKPIYKNLGYDTLEDLIKDKFIGFSLEKNLNRLKQDNSKENYSSYKERYGENLKIITKPQNLL
jgi:hypothetical protein